MKFRNIQPRSNKITEDKFEEGRLYVCVETEEYPDAAWIGALSYMENGKRYGLKKGVAYESDGEFFGKRCFFKPDNHTKHFKGVTAYTEKVFEKTWV